MMNDLRRQTRPAQVAFLHTSPLHIATFDRLRDEMAPDLKISHAVREDLLCAAEKAGGVGPGLALKAREALAGLAGPGVKVVVCTCSTLGPISEDGEGLAGFGAGEGVVFMRIDRAMADEAVARGRRVGVCACLPAALDPAEALVRSSAVRLGRAVEVRRYLFDEVWPLFRQGRLEDYTQGIADRLMSAMADVDVLVLAQASMAPAVGRCGKGEIPILSSPESGFRAILRAVAST